MRFISSDFDINTIHHNTTTDNKVGDVGVKALCDGLMMNKLLIELRLESENMTQTRNGGKLD